MRNDRNHETPTARECFTLYELIESLSQHQEGHGTSKIEIKTMTGKGYTFECEGKTVEDFLEFLSTLDSPMDVVVEYCRNTEIDYSHAIYTRRNPWMYHIEMHYRSGAVI